MELPLLPPVVLITAVTSTDIFSSPSNEFETLLFNCFVNVIHHVAVGLLQKRLRYQVWTRQVDRCPKQLRRTVS